MAEIMKQNKLTSFWKISQSYCDSSTQCEPYIIQLQRGKYKIKPPEVGITGVMVGLINMIRVKVVGLHLKAVETMIRLFKDNSRKL